MTEYTGPERRSGIHVWRWRALAIWIVVFTLIVFLAIRNGRHATNELKKDKASIASLQQTDCALRQFLLAAREARLRTAQRDTDPVKKAADLKAAEGYARLSKVFSKHDCEGTGTLRGD